MDYTTLSRTDVSRGLQEVAQHTETTFGSLDGRQVNWRPAEGVWSVGQCLEHLLIANRLMFTAADAALSGAQARSVWQRLPVLPALWGRLLIRSQSPGSKRKYTASLKAQPAPNDVAPEIVSRFVTQHREAIARLETLGPGELNRTIMTSPFVGVITYSVLDGWRLVLAHDWRHLEQARRVTEAPDFPRDER